MGYTPFDTKDFIVQMRDFGYKPMRYSGRGMYGAECVGIPTDDPFTLGLTIGREFDRNVSDYFNDAATCYDALGRGMIYYWPSLKWPDDVPEEEDDDEEGVEDEEA